MLLQFLPNIVIVLEPTNQGGSIREEKFSKKNKLHLRKGHQKIEHDLAVI